MFDKSKVKKIHFIVIGGIGMSGMAELLLKSGYLISGSDIKENDRTIFLSSLGVEVFIGHNAQNINDSDLIVYSSAVKIDNIEILEGKKRGTLVIKRAEMLAELIRLKPVSIGVSGTHGKTTTCSLIGSILFYAEKDPTLAVGGIVKSFNTNAISGKGDIILVEADEYDKSFLSLSPTIAIINNIELEHLDCYEDIDDLRKSFKYFANNIPFYGFVAINLDDKNLEKIKNDIKRPLVTYSIDGKANYVAKNISFNKNNASFDLYVHDKFVDTIFINIPGKHNVYNVLCAISVCYELDIEIDIIKNALINFKGVKRRFDIKYKDDQYIYIDDYAHHPTEVSATLKSVLEGWQNKKIISIFQPHLFSRTQMFCDEFADSLYCSDTVILLDIFGGREAPIENVSSKLIFDKLSDLGHNNVVLCDKKDLVRELDKIIEPNSMIITMGAGDVFKYGKEIIKILTEK